MVGECFQLVAGLDRDALGQIAAADAGGARAQRLDGNDHSARQEQPGKQRERKRRQQQYPRALDRGVERRISFGDR